MNYPSLSPLPHNHSAPTKPNRRVAVGRTVEAHVAEALVERGYVIVARNFRIGRDELDLLALDGDTLVVLEVRYRREGSIAPAHTTINRAKARRLRRATLRIAAQRECADVRVDVVAVDGDQIELYPNAVDFTST